MQDKNRNFNASIANGGIMIALAVTAAAAWLPKDATLNSVRPSASEAVYRGVAYHDVDARLWQDPFAAVEAKLAARNGSSPSAEKQVECAPAKNNRGVMPRSRTGGVVHDRHCDSLKDEINEYAAAPTVLAVMAPGAPYPEIAEVRRRLRYAVVAGLSHQGFRPEDADHIDYHLPKNASSAKLNFVPYEWFEARSGASRVLVLWVNENALIVKKEFKPVGALSELLTELGLSDASQRTSEALRPQISIIGPYSSDTLSAIRKENCRDTLPHGIKFWSYGPTTEQREKKETNDGCDIAFTLSSDAELARAIQEELRLRNIIPQQHDHVALVAEWDTRYGDQIVETMKSAWGCASCDDNIIVRRYLRGLDGGLPPESKQKQKTSDSATDAAEEKVSAESEARAFDRFEGLSQYDYLRRLEDQLREQDSKLRGGPFGTGLRAIGVLGSDVFDKLLVLRALKPAFPNVVFFTTDFDASLQRASEITFTRNLVVASSYGSRLDDRLQGYIPPFRSAYQTSAFVATQAALGKVAERDFDSLTKGAQVFEMTAQGRLHELARHGASVAKDNPRGPMEAAFPDMSDAQKFAASIGFLLMAAPIAAFIFSSRRKLGKAATGGNQTSATVDGGPEAFPLIGPFLAFWLVAIAIAVLFWRGLAEFLHERGDGELIAVMDGVSVWPTIALRIFLISLAVVFIGLARRRLLANSRKIEEELLLGSQGASAKAQDIPGGAPILGYFRYWPSFFSPHSPTFLPADKSTPDGVSRDVKAAWRNYLKAGDSVMWRAFIASLVLLVSFVVLAYVFDGVLPIIRGPLASHLFLLTLLIEFFAVVFLTVYVADATAHCLAFVNDLEYHHTEWPESATSQYVRQAQAAQSDEPTKDRTLKIVNDEKDLRFIELRTSCILPLVYMPFLLIALTIVERSNVFAAYSFSGVVALAEAAALLMVLLCAWAMSRDAERARAMAIDHLERAILDAKRGVYKLMEQDVLGAMLERTKGLSGGAFSPLWSQPIVTGLILPAIGVASHFLFERNWLSGVQ